MASVTILPTSGRFSHGDARWLDEQSDLFAMVRSAEPTAVRSVVAVPGTKGIANDILVPLISAGALTAVVEALRTWLGRDDGRAVRVSFGDAGGIREVELTGKAFAGDIGEAVEAKLLALIDSS